MNEGKLLTLEPQAQPCGDTVLARILDLDRAGETNSAINVLYEHIDDLLLERQYSLVDDLLTSANVWGFSVDVLIAFLTITLSAKRSLHSRSGFIERVERRLSDERRAQEMRLLLAGLE